MQSNYQIVKEHMTYYHLSGLIKSLDYFYKNSGGSFGRWRKRNYIYFVSDELPTEDEDDKEIFVKIGITNNPASRLRKLQVGNPRKLHLIHLEALEEDVSRKHAMHIEKDLHSIHNRFRGEWCKTTRGKIIESVIDHKLKNTFIQNLWHFSDWVSKQMVAENICGDEIREMRREMRRE